MWLMSAGAVGMQHPGVWIQVWQRRAAALQGIAGIADRVSIGEVQLQDDLQASVNSTER